MRETYHQSANTFSEKTTPLQTTSVHALSIKSGYCFLKKKDQYHKIQIENIRYIQAQGDYTLLSTSEGDYLSSYSLNEIEQLFNTYSFIKTHRSYLININNVTAINPKNNVAILGDLTIPISRSMKANFLDRFYFM